MAIDLSSTMTETTVPKGAPPGFCPGAPETPRANPQPKQPLQGRLRLGAAWVILGRSSGIGITMLVNMLLAHWLSPEEFGDFLLLSSVLALASVLATVGLNTAIVRFVSESMGRGDIARARQAMRLVMAVAAVTISGVAALAALAMAYFDTSVLGLPADPGLVPMAVTALVLLAMLQLIAEACRSLHELRMATLFSGGQTGGLLSNLVFLVLIAAGMVVGKPSFLTAVALNLTAMALSLPLAILGLWRTVRERLVATAPQHTTATLTAGQLLAYSLPLLLIQLLTFATTQGDLWIAGIWCRHDQLALYGAARRLILLVAMPLQMLNLTVVALIAELHSQGRTRDLERMLRGAASLAAWPSAGAIVLLTLAGGPILELLFGPYFRQAALPLGILAVGQLFLVCAGSSSWALSMTGHQLGSLLISLISALALAVIGAWSARNFGILGLSITSSSVIALQSICLWLLAKKLVGVWTHPALRPSLTLN
jgi:O-antigen/teichoic acid export membrane protein